PADRSPATDDDRSGLPGRGESAVAALALAVVSGHADDASALAPPAGRAPLDLRWSKRPAAHRPGDPRTGAAPRAPESALGYQRIVGELNGLGLAVSATTVKKILREA